MASPTAWRNIGIWSLYVAGAASVLVEILVVSLYFSRFKFDQCGV